MVIYLLSLRWDVRDRILQRRFRAMNLIKVFLLSSFALAAKAEPCAGTKAPVDIAKLFFHAFRLLIPEYAA